MDAPLGRRRLDGGTKVFEFGLQLRHYINIRVNITLRVNIIIQLALVVIVIVVEANSTTHTSSFILNHRVTGGS